MSWMPRNFLMLLCLFAGMGKATDSISVDPNMRHTPTAPTVWQRLDSSLADLGNLVIHERVERYVGSGARTHRRDSLDAVVEVVDGVEQYSGIWRGGRAIPEVAQLGGLWSFGELATLLRVTREALRKPVIEDGGDICFLVPASQRRWYIGVDGKTFWLDFEGHVTVSPLTGEISRIDWISAPAPAGSGVARVTWSVLFHSVEVGGRNFTLPAEATYRVARAGAGNRAEWNVTTFSDYARYGAEATISFAPE